jgi:PhnB protein
MSSFVPPGWPTVTPRIFAEDDEQLVAFIKRVFEAQGDYLHDRPTVLTIGSSVIMVSGTEIRKATAAFLYVYVDDTDAAYRRAIAAGARSVEAPALMPYGDKRCMVEDRWGNTWQIATYMG